MTTKTIRTYWRLIPRGFANEYTIGIATSHQFAKQYAAAGYERISRDLARRELTYRGDNATEAFVSVTVDNDDGNHDRFELARELRK
jgi:hypothetical protein